MPRVVHFEIHAEDPERAVAFYTRVFDWQFSKWDGPMPYWLIKTGPDDQRGINGGLLRRHGTIDGQAVIACRSCGTMVSVRRSDVHRPPPETAPEPPRRRRRVRWSPRGG